MTQMTKLRLASVEKLLYKKTDIIHWICLMQCSLHSV